MYHDSNSKLWKLDKKWEDHTPKEWIEIFEDGINEPSDNSIRNSSGWAEDKPAWLVFWESAVRGTMKEVTTSWSYGSSRRRMAWKLVPLALVWVVERTNRRSFEGIEMKFAKLIDSILYLFSFWCTHKALLCIDDWVLLVENHLFRRGFIF
nr:uncharacterized protein LOC117274471 isoform X1 [Nicotiana tomentosiformis]